MTTSTQTQLRRGTATQVAAMTPATGEAVVNTTNSRIHVGDGATAGGIQHANSVDVQNQKFSYPSVGGTGDAITLTNTPAKTALAVGQKGTFKAGANNTTATTINEDGLGVKNLKKMHGTALAALAANDLISGGMYDYFWDGTQYQIKGLGEGPFTTGGLVYLGSVTASNNATIDLLSMMSSTYDDYEIIINNITPVSLGDPLLMRFSTDNSTFDTGSNYGYSVQTYTAGTSSGFHSTATASIQIADSVQSGGCSARIRLHNVNNTSALRLVTGEAAYINSDIVTAKIGASWTSSTHALEAVRFLTGSSNISSGTFKMYGISKS